MRTERYKIYTTAKDVAHQRNPRQVELLVILSQRRVRASSFQSNKFP